MRYIYSTILFQLPSRVSRRACPAFAGGLCVFILFTVLLSCQSKKQADLIVYNATVYTVDSAFTTTEAIAIKDGRIIATGKTADLLAQYDAKEKKDAQGKFIYPGLIDAHAHFFRYGTGLQTANLVGTTSWDDILKKLQSFAAENKEGWIIGRGPAEPAGRTSPTGP